MGVKELESETVASDEEVKRLEGRVDEFFSSMELRHYPRNLAQWMVLTRCALEVQKASADEYGGSKHRVAVINHSRVAALLLDQIARFGNQRYAGQRSLQWSSQLASETHRALQEGTGYFTANSYFPAWYQGRCTAITSGDRIRFVSDESAKQRQFHAFQKGIVPKQHRRPTSSDHMPLTPRITQLFQQCFSSCGGLKSKKLRYPVPRDLYLEVLPWFREATSKLVRRHDQLSLGQYTIGQIRAFWPALQSICAVHDYLCFIASLQHEFPANSAVLSKTVSEWIEELVPLCALETHTLGAIIEDLTFGDRKPVDLHQELFVSLTKDGHIRGLLPHFALSTRMDENLLRTLSRNDQDLYNKISTSKEQELIEDARVALSGKLSVSGPFELPKEARTNLDLVLVDEPSSVLLLAELKWIRKPAFIKERLRADQEFLHGLEQLEKVRAFLQANPEYLKTRRAVTRNFDEYDVYFGLVGLEHLVWSDTGPRQFVVEYDILKKGLQEAANLKTAISRFQNYDWLPIEGTDFDLRFESATVNGVIIEGQSFFTL
jgi:hypothetical protein